MPMRHIFMCGQSRSTEFFHIISQMEFFLKGAIENKM
jgi:hypothetical protein